MTNFAWQRQVRLPQSDINRFLFAGVVDSAELGSFKYTPARGVVKQIWVGPLLQTKLCSKEAVITLLPTVFSCHNNKEGKDAHGLFEFRAQFSP